MDNDGESTVIAIGHLSPKLGGPKVTQHAMNIIITIRCRRPSTKCADGNYSVGYIIQYAWCNLNGQ